MAYYLPNITYVLGVGGKGTTVLANDFFLFQGMQKNHFRYFTRT